MIKRRAGAFPHPAVLLGPTPAGCTNSGSPPYASPLVSMIIRSRSYIKGGEPAIRLLIPSAGRKTPLGRNNLSPGEKVGGGAFLPAEGIPSTQIRTLE